jgi:hypothetical protein
MSVADDGGAEVSRRAPSAQRQPVRVARPSLGVPEISLAYHWLDASGALYEYGGGPACPTVRPGETIRLVAHVLPPWQPGRYLLKWDPLIENVPGSRVS